MACIHHLRQVVSLVCSGRRGARGLCLYYLAEEGRRGNCSESAEVALGTSKGTQQSLWCKPAEDRRMFPQAQRARLKALRRGRGGHPFGPIASEVAAAEALGGALDPHRATIGVLSLAVAG